MNLKIRTLYILQLLAFLNTVHALTTAPVEVSVIKGNGTRGSISRYYVRRKLNSTGPNNLKPLDGIGDISKLLRELKIKEPINQDPGTNRNGTDRYKVFIKRKLRTFKHPRKSKKDRKENATTIFVQSYQNQGKYLPASKSRVHYKKISIGKPIIVYRSSKHISPYAIRSEKQYGKHNKQEANLGLGGESGEISRIALEDAQGEERLHEDETQETRQPQHRQQGTTSTETEVSNVPIATDGEFQGNEKDININENINEHSQELEEEAQKDLPNIEKYISLQEPEFSHGQDDILHDLSLFSENSELLPPGSSDSDDYIQLDIDHTPGSQKPLHHTSDSQTSLGSHPSGQFSDTMRNKLRGGSHENEWTEFYEGDEEESLFRDLLSKQRPMSSSGLVKAIYDDDNNKEEYSPQKQQHVNNVHDYIDNVKTRLSVDNINQGQTNLPSDLPIQKKTNSVQPGLINEDQIFVPNDRLDQEQTDIPVSNNEEFKPALTAGVDEKPYDHINHEDLREQQHSDPTRNRKMQWINLPVDQTVPENIGPLNGNIGHKQTNTFLNQDRVQVASGDIHQEHPHTVSGLIHNGEMKWTGLSSAKIFKENMNALSKDINPEPEVFVTHINHPEVLDTHINEASSGNIAEEEPSFNFNNQGVSEVSPAHIDQERSHITFDRFNDWHTEWTDLSSTLTFKENSYSHNENFNPEQNQEITAHFKGDHKCVSCGNIPQEQSPHDPLNVWQTEWTDLSSTQDFKGNIYAHNENVNPEQTQVPPAHIKGEHKCGPCSNIPQEQSYYDHINQEVVKVPSEIHKEQPHTVSAPVNSENAEWSDISSTKIFKEQTHFPSSDVYHDQAHIFPIHINQETHTLPETYDTENMQNLKVKDHEINTFFNAQEEPLLNKHLFALNKLRELVIRLEIRLRIDDNIQLSSFYKMMKLIFLVFKSQVTEDNSQYSIWFRQLNPVVRYRLIKYVNNLIRRRWVQQLMTHLHNNHYNLDIAKHREWSSHLISWNYELNYDLHRFLDRPITERDVREKNLGLFTITRPYRQSHHVYHFMRPRKLSKIFG